MEQPRVNVGVLLRRQLIPVAIAIGVGVVVLLGQFISNITLDNIVGVLISWGAIVGAFALLLGLANLVLFHTKRIVKRDREMPFSILILASALVVFLLALPSGGTGAVMFINRSKRLFYPCLFFSSAPQSIARCAYAAGKWRYLRFQP
ncbi:hypothetical protein FBQ82_12070 [Anaerolineae bacterium CFX7]|nr:hypothetical protein [Anaerolineae bacterium CFX7]